MKSISYYAGFAFGTTKSIVSRIPQPDVDKIKADFKQAIADQQAPKPEPMISAQQIADQLKADQRDATLAQLEAAIDRLTMELYR